MSDARWRRRVLIVGLAALVFCLLLGLLIHGVLRSDALERRVAERVSALALDSLDRQLQIGDIELSAAWNFKRLRIVVTDAVLPGPGGEADRPVARLKRLEAQIGLWDLIARRLALQSVAVAGLDVFVERTADGTNLPSLTSEQGADESGGLEVAIGTVLVRDSLVTVNDLEIPLHGKTGDVRLELAGGPESASEGRFEITALDLAHAEYEPMALDLTGDLSIRDGGFALQKTRLEGDGLLALLELRFDPKGKGALLHGKLELETAGEWLARHTPVSDLVGPLELRADLRSGEAGEEVTLERLVGDASFHSTDLTFRGLALGDVTVSGSLAEGKAQLESEPLQLAQGTVQLTGAWTNQQEIAAQVSARGVRLVELLRAFPELELEPVVLSSTAALDLAWRYELAGEVASKAGPVPGTVNGELRLKPAKPPRPLRANDLPLALAGTVPFELAQGVLGLRNVALTLPGPFGSQPHGLSGSVRLDLTNERPGVPAGKARIELASGHLDHLADQFRSFWQTTLVGSPLEGLELLGAPGGSQLEGQLDLSWPHGLTRWSGKLDVESGAVVARVGEDRLRLERFEARLRRTATDSTTDTSVLATLGTGGVVKLEGRLPAIRKTSVVAQPVGVEEPLRLEVESVDLQPVLALVGFEDLELTVSGDGELQSWTSAELHLQAPEVLYAEEPLGALEVQVSLAEDGVSLAPVRLRGERGEVELQGRVEFQADAGGEFEDNTPRLDLEFMGQGLDLGSPLIARVLPGAAGRAELVGSLRGTLQHPRADLVVHGDALEYPGAPDQGVTGHELIRLSLDGGVLELEAELPGLIRVARGSAATALIEEVPLVSEASWLEAFDLEIQELDLAGVAELAMAFGRLGDEAYEAPAFLEDLGGKAKGSLRYLVDAPEGVAPLEVALMKLGADWSGRTLELVQPLHLRVGPRGVEADVLYLVEKGGTTEVIATGGLDWSGEHPALDVSIESLVDVSFLEALSAPLTGRGSLQVLARITGSPDQPQINGQGALVAEELVVADFPHSLESFDARLLFYPEFMVLDRLTSNVAEGRLRGQGRIDWPTSDSAVDAGAQARVDLQASLDDAFLLLSEDWQVRLSAEVGFEQTPLGERRLVGQVDLDQAAYYKDVPVSIDQLMRAFMSKERVVASTADPLLDSVKVLLDIEGADAIRIRNNIAELDGDIELVLQGTLARPVLVGEIQLASGGTLEYGGEEYRIAEGSLHFADPYRINPILDIVATTKRRDYEVVLALSGTTDRLEAELRSDPPLSELDVLSLLAAGDVSASTSDSGLGPRTSDGAVSASSLLYGQASTIVGQRVNRLFGLDRFRLDPLQSGDTLSSARVTVGKQLSRDVFVTYSVDSSSTDNSVLEVEWRLSPRVVLILSQTADGSYSVDARFEQSL